LASVAIATAALFFTKGLPSRKPDDELLESVPVVD
jgi:hypothetical protein